MQKGYWNGEQIATFIGVTYEVTESQRELGWQNLYIGSRRQGIKVTVENYSWIMDNQHGDAYYKITKGEGAPQCGHKDVDNPINIIEIPDIEIFIKYDHVGLKMEEAKHDEWCKNKNPELFKKLQSLKALIRKS